MLWGDDDRGRGRGPNPMAKRDATTGGTHERERERPMRVEVNIDCADADVLRAFYCAALGYEARGEAGTYRACLPAGDAIGPKIVFQQVPEPKTVKNRMHLDVIVDDIEAEAARWIALGATRITVEPVREHGGAWIVMGDPEGNEICLCDS
jgi:predicted enzyme related to lactoylglutathione lyase